MKNKQIKRAYERFNMEYWGNGYFAISDQGQIEVYPDKRHDLPPINLVELCHAINEQDLKLPILVRFMDILRDRIDTMKNAFNQAMEDADYPANYHCVYPIKTNQQRHVLDEIIHHGGQSVGLEAGSKPELLAALGLAKVTPSLIICNGYKDRTYIRLALIGMQMGHQVFIIIEKLSELEIVLAEAKKMQIQPLLGVRIRLASIGKGRWQNTGGIKSKFGLSSSQILQLINRLQQEQVLDYLQLMHFHMGSQIANIRDIQNGLSECARYFAEFHQLGVCINYVDVGGGLSVDYQGTQSRHCYSMNYSIDEYARQIVQALCDICKQYDLPYPHIITESGRALTAHHAVLITNVIDKESSTFASTLLEPKENVPAVISHLWQSYIAINEKNAIECFYNIGYALSKAHSLFNHGLLTLQERAWAEQLYQAAGQRIQKCLDPRFSEQQTILNELNENLADKFFCNFSLFQSIPDVWGIQQIFPILPLARLDEKLTQQVTIHDITCDSDGRIDCYINGRGLDNTLAMPSYRVGEDYLIGFFLVGAYQEILGDMHNLFGDTHSINVYRDDINGFRLAESEHGDIVADVLKYVHISIEDLFASFRKQLEAISLKPGQKVAYLTELAEGLLGYTYLEASATR